MIKRRVRADHGSHHRHPDRPRRPLSAGGVLPEKSPKTASQEAHASALETSEKEIRPACNQHELVYRDLTMPCIRTTRGWRAGQTEGVR